MEKVKKGDCKKKENMIERKNGKLLKIKKGKANAKGRYNKGNKG
jgi:hypothetical protein